MFFLSFLTLLVRRIIAFCRFDLKEIIAFSTLSHIRFMFISLYNNIQEGAFFHLCTHALFKALIFMCSGIIIHLSGYQDIRKLRFFYLNSKIKIIFLFSVITIIGLPFVSGYLSKDYIIDLSNG